VKQARVKLNKLEMKDDLIDKYIAKYKTLLKKAEISYDEVGAL
jgi:hypothetical protein